MAYEICSIRKRLYTLEQHGFYHWNDAHGTEGTVIDNMVFQSIETFGPTKPPTPNQD